MIREALRSQRKGGAGDTTLQVRPVVDIHDNGHGDVNPVHDAYPLQWNEGTKGQLIEKKHAAGRTSCAIREHMRPTSIPIYERERNAYFVFAALLLAAKILIAARPDVAKVIEYQSDVDSKIVSHGRERQFRRHQTIFLEGDPGPEP